MGRITKRIIAIAVSLVIGVASFTGCNNGEKGVKENNNVIKEEVESNNSSEISAKEIEVKAEEIFNTLNDDIDGDSMLEDIKFLTSKECDGRLPGTEGNELATEYIVKEFKEIGLEIFKDYEGYKHTYEQYVPYVNELPVMEIIDSEGKVIESMVYLDDFSAEASFFFGKKGEIEGEVVYYSDVQELLDDKDKIEGKIVMGPGAIVYSSRVRNAIDNDEFGAKALIYVRSNKDRKKGKLMKMVYYNQRKPDFRSEDRPLYAVCTEKTSVEIIEKTKNGLKLRLKIDNSAITKGVSNVVGMIPGTDENLKDEYVFITGHFDHLGNNHDGTYNPGASDNASGIASLLEIARSIKENDIKPKKTIVFVAFNGEENGLVGSSIFCNSNKEEVAKSINLNIDMIANVAKGPLYISSVRNSLLSMDIKEIAEELGVSIKMKFRVDYSDHASFEAMGAQAVTFVEEEQEEYHTPLDTIEIIEKQDLEDVVEIVLKYISERIF